MALRVRFVDGLREFSAAADKAFAALHEGIVDGVRVQPFGGEQLQRSVMAFNVDRADIGDHMAGDLIDDGVEQPLAVGGALP